MPNQIERNLDGIYFRVQRNEKYVTLCFSDLTEDEMRSVLKNADKEYLLNMCVILGKTVREIGDNFNIIRNYDEE